MYQNKGRLFLKLLIPLASGMLAAYWSGLFLPLWYLIPTVLILGAIYFLVHRKYLYTIRYSWFYGFSVTVFLFVVGFSFFSSDYALNHADHFINFKKDDFLILKINEPPVFKEKFVRCVVQAEKAGSKNQFHSCSGNAVAYFSNTNESLKFHYGDLVVVKNKPSALDAPNIPYQYDYKGYLDKKNIHFSIFLREKEFVPLIENDGYILLRIAYSLRDWCVNCIKKYVASPKEAAVVSALTVGYRDEVTQDIVQSFSSAGVIHILAVSGMHVGLLYAMLLIILNFIFGKSRAKILKLIVLLSAIWLFAMVTGLSGSIVRASTMISAVIISKSINRRIDIINALCVSAFVLLLITPFIFIDAGFQLSFTALVGIALWERNFAQMIEFRNPLLHLVWRMCSVSMAAQLGVLPLTLFYFNQFPLLFLVANIIGVPLSTGILFGGLALFVLSLVPPVAVYAGMILKWSTQLLDNYINWVQSFSFSTLNIPSFGIASLILTAIALYFFYEFIERRIPRKIIYSLATMLIVIVINTFSSIGYLQKKELLFLHFGKGDLYVFRERNNALMIADDTLLNDAYFSQYTNSFLKHTPVSNLQIIPMSSINDSSTHHWKKFSSYGKFISFEGMKGVLVDDDFQSSPEKIHLDFVIGKTSHLKAELLKENFTPDYWIADSDQKNFNFKSLKNRCAQLSLPLHYLPIDGPWIKQF